MEEYVDEAEFALERIQSACQDPEYVLDEIEKGPQEKFLACVDGLVIGGQRVVDRLLVPELEGLDDLDLHQERASAVLFSLLMSGQKDPVQRCFGSACQVLRVAASRAAGLYPEQDIEDWLRDLLAQAEGAAERAALLEAVAMRRMESDAWKASLKSQVVQEQVAALRALRYADVQGFVPLVEALAMQRDASDELRKEALISAVYCGSQRVWAWVRKAAFDAGHPASQVAMGLLAGLGSASERERLLAAVDDPALEAGALFALGLSGQSGIVDGLLDRLEDDGLEVEKAKRVGEAIAMISGLPLYEDAFVQEQPRVDEDEVLAPLEEDVGLDELLLDPVEDLPVLKVQAVRDWWHRQDVRASQARLVMGRTWGPEGVAFALEHAPMRWRKGIALEVAVRTRGIVDVPTFGLTMVQRRFVREVSGLDERLFSRRVF